MSELEMKCVECGAVAEFPTVLVHKDYCPFYVSSLLDETDSMRAIGPGEPGYPDIPGAGSYTPSWRSRVVGLVEAFRYGFRQIAGEIGLKFLRYSTANSNLVAHAKNEWKLAFSDRDEIQDAIGQNVFDIIAAFSAAGHSGFSASYTIGLVEKIMRYQTLSPLTGADDEWFCYGEDMAPDGVTEFFQNKRDSRVFKNGRDGVPYMIDGRIFREPDGATYTSGNSKVDLPPFPCYPPEPVYVDVDEEGEEILDLTSPVVKLGDMEFSKTPSGGVHVTWETDGIEIDREFTADQFNTGIGKMIGGFTITEGTNDGT